MKLNNIKVDQRLSDVKTKTQYQTIVSGKTTFTCSTGDVSMGNNYITTTKLLMCQVN